jgi:hypothetical protein
MLLADIGFQLHAISKFEAGAFDGLSSLRSLVRRTRATSHFDLKRCSKVNYQALVVRSAATSHMRA